MRWRGTVIPERYYNGARSARPAYIKSAVEKRHLRVRRRRDRGIIASGDERRGHRRIVYDPVERLVNAPIASIE